MEETDFMTSRGTVALGSKSGSVDHDIDWSDDVRDVLQNAYRFVKPHAHIEKNSSCEAPDSSLMDLKKVMSVPPLVSVVRISSLKTNVENAVKVLGQDINLVDKFHEKAFYIFKEDGIPDALFIESTDTTRNVTPCALEVIVGELCACSVLRGADVYAPGVIGADAGIQRGDIVAVYGDIDGSCRRGLTSKFLGRKFFLGNAVARLSRKELFVGKVSSGIALQIVDPVYRLPSFAHISPTLFFPQNFPSLIVGYVMDPKPCEWILDMCAAPGGKTTHMAQLARDKAHIVAIDKTANKVEKIITNCKQLGLSSVKTFVYDSTKLWSGDCDQSDQEEEMLPPFQSETFDKILLDPPCSALGQRPRLRCKLSKKELNSYPIYQRKLIRQAVPLLKVNGTLVFSTCTITVEENENQVQWILTQYPELKLDNQTPFLGKCALKGHALPDELCERVQRFDPFLSYHRSSDTVAGLFKSRLEQIADDSIGFFIAKFVKISKTIKNKPKD